MPDRYNKPAQGTTNWHLPLNNNFNDLDVDVEHRDSTDPDSAGITPADGAKFLDTSTGEIYLADGNSWSLEWDLGAIGSGGGGGGDVDPSSVGGIDNVRQHVGPTHQGGYHAQDFAWGVAFEADGGLPINSVVIDMDAANATASEATVSLYESQTTSAGDANQDQPVVPDGMTESEALIGSATTSVTAGPKRVELGLETPTNPATGEFFIGVESPGTPFRRILDWGAANYEAETYDQISLLYSGRWNNTTTSDYTANYYRTFDIEVGDPTTQVTSPWSRDVDEIYMRPRDPEEEFDNISPRALWLDTS